MSDAVVHLRVPAATKARWVRESRAAGMRLTDWITTRVEAMAASIIQRTRSGHFDLYLYGKYAGQYDSHSEAVDAAKQAGEARVFRFIDAMKSKAS